MKILSLLPISVTLVGVCFLFKLKCFFILHPKKTAKKAIASSGGKNAIGSLSLALAGTLGVGNIVGVAVGISVGGPGAVFWLLVSSVFALVIKYCESSISSDIGDGIGMIGVVKKSFGKYSRSFSVAYAALVLILSFVMGAALQSASIGQSVRLGAGISPFFTALILILLLLIPITLGSDKIEKITVIIIPLTTIIYIFLSLSTIIANIEKFPCAIRLVIGSAFESESISGGIVGFFLSDKIKEGYLRGILSNEAGAGTSSFAHSKNKTEDNGAVGVMGMCEVFFDTVILCMLTAFATLVSVDNFENGSGVGIILSGIGSVFGKSSEYLLLLCIFFFAYSTIVCWYYYGICAYRYLFSRGSISIFSVLFLVSAILGVGIEGDRLIFLIDFLLLFLSLISLSALMKNSDRIKTLSEKSGLLSIKK